jgi:hypothetical protein
MKERIKLLADKAGQLQLATPDNSSADEIMVLIGPNIEKFAELIVGECFYCVEIMEKIAHASNADIPPDYDQHTYLKTLEAVTGLMKAHFGVEL